MDGVTDSEEEIVAGLKQLVREHIGGFAVPEGFLVCALCICVCLCVLCDIGRGN